ncbi:hypothetical protein ACP70R_008069 [Stipagrostis hirtigluma subsp. patula]
MAAGADGDVDGGEGTEVRMVEMPTSYLVWILSQKRERESGPRSYVPTELELLLMSPEQIEQEREKELMREFLGLYLPNLAKALNVCVVGFRIVCFANTWPAPIAPIKASLVIGACVIIFFIILCSCATTGLRNVQGSAGTSRSLDLSLGQALPRAAPRHQVTPWSCSSCTRSYVPTESELMLMSPEQIEQERHKEVMREESEDEFFRFQAFVRDVFTKHGYVMMPEDRIADGFKE